ncbi:MAG: type V CRISPR-associated protein Cas12a/Cpf1 [Bacteroidia bacterium]|nr:type V CRISPR-associated protein Cas12a/Cpf1 [Bacteroidia bacterium]
MKTINDFTKRYQLSKTLRFELKPIGKTKEHVEAKGLISQDEQRAESYKAMKKTIDAFHKDFIEKAMANVKLSSEDLNQFQALYTAPSEKKKEDVFKKELEKVQTSLRKAIVKGFNTGEAKEIYGKIDKKELFTELLEPWIARQKEKDFHFDETFKTFTTYFGGFHENRKNMYSDKAQSTAIAFRLIHENLPKFIDNIAIFEKVKTIPELYAKCETLYKEIEEFLNINKIDEAFELYYYNEILTQKQIDVFNLIIGGRTEEEGKKKIQGLNEYINLYNQQQKDKSKKVAKLKLLYKQILSDRNSISFLPDAFESVQELLDSIENYYKSNLEEDNILDKIKELLAQMNDFDLSKIHIKNDTSLTTISQKLFGDYGFINIALSYYYSKVVDPDFEVKYAKAKNPEKLDEAQAKFLKQSYFSIQVLHEALDIYIQNLDKSEIPTGYSKTCIADYFTLFFKAAKKEGQEKEFGLIDNIQAKYSCIQGILGNDYPKNKSLIQDKNDLFNIKAFLDGIMELVHFVKPLSLPKDSVLEKDEKFYSQLDTLSEPLNQLIPLYNKVRNYATQKPYKTEKIKLNFENSTLLDGWDVNKEESNTSILFEKNGNYYLGIMDKNQNKIFRNIPKSNEDNPYRKVNYKLLPGASKMLPKVFFSNKNIDFYNPNEEILKIRNHSTHTKGGTPQSGFEKMDFNLNDCHKMIDFFKDSIDKHPDWKEFAFEFSDTKSYESIDSFYREVEFQGYKITYSDVDSSYIDQLVDEGKLYLFQIYNKDFSPHSKGKPNMHTMYWKALFEPENLKDVIYKLNGQAEVFFRKKSIDKPTIHKANEAIANKNPLATKKESTFEYELIKDKRFTVDKFQFHVPITLNFKATGAEFINHDVLQHLKTHPDTYIIGLDRGERHLIYLSLINPKGEIILQESLNNITSENYPISTPYHQLLNKKEEERANARVNWGAIENIKELKEGYVSQVVHKIAKLMVEYNAIVVMEDLNFGFKRGRFKVEKQVYQKLEKMLIDKLNYLVFKDKPAQEPGGLYNALQLTNKFTSFKEMGKQSGFLFYVPAWNTSKIDPTTGFVNFFYTRYENLEKAKAFFEKFEDIRYNAAEKYFEFVVEDYTAFNAKAEGTRQNWTICTQGERILTYRNPDANHNWDNKTIQLTAEFIQFFESKNIDYKADLKTQILANNEAAFFKKLMDLFKLTLQMRNSISNSDVDYLISPVKNKKGEFYDSRKADKTLPQDADANGAYHIAKKGLMWLQQIQNFKGEDWKKLNLEKSNKGWLEFVQKSYNT